MTLHESDDWDRHWDRYAESASLNPAQDLRFGLVLQTLREFATRTARLLDAGSGQGDFLAKAVAAGAAGEYVGFELSQSGVRIARAKVPQAQFFSVDLYTPSAGADRFVNWASAAVCSEVLEHLDDPAAFLRSLRRYLDNDAVLVVTVPAGPRSKFDEHIGHRRHFTKTSLHALLEGSGFAVQRIWAAGFPFFNLYRLVVIARGSQLIRDVELGAAQSSSGLARFAMRVFSVLFRFTMKASPFGWQLIAVARKVEQPGSPSPVT